MVMIVSGNVSLLSSRNNGTEKQFPIDILNLTDKNSLVEQVFGRFSG